MRDPDLVTRAQRAAARLESAWERWRTRQGLGGAFAQPVASYVGYAPEEPRGRPRVVFGVDAAEAEQLATLLDGDNGLLPAGRPGARGPAFGLLGTPAPDDLVTTEPPPDAVGLVAPVHAVAPGVPVPGALRPVSAVPDAAPSVAPDGIAQDGAGSAVAASMTAPLPAVGDSAAGRAGSSPDRAAAVWPSPHTEPPAVVTPAAVTAVTTPADLATADGVVHVAAAQDGTAVAGQCARSAAEVSLSSASDGRAAGTAEASRATVAGPVGADGSGEATDPGGAVGPYGSSGVVTGPAGAMTSYGSTGVLGACRTEGAASGRDPAGGVPPPAVAAHITAELAGWATGELPGQASAGLADWTRDGCGPPVGTGTSDASPVAADTERDGAGRLPWLA